MDYSDRQVIVTGGTGALGSAVVGALVEAGATCYVPWRHESEAQRFPFREHNRLNLVSCFLCCSAAVNSISRSGHGGRIVNVAARHALEWRGGAGLVSYTASKAAVAALTVALSEEVAKEGILVNAVAPSIMDTPANRAAMPKADYKAWPKVEEVAATILFLASPENKVTRGAVVPVYGQS